MSHYFEKHTMADINKEPMSITINGFKEIGFHPIINKRKENIITVGQNKVSKRQIQHDKKKKKNKLATNKFN
jgi:hypothetical protein